MPVMQLDRLGASATPDTLARDISPPTRRCHQSRRVETGAKIDPQNEGTKVVPTPSLPAAVEAGLIRIQSHLDYFAKEFARRGRPQRRDQPRMGIPQFKELYVRNDHPKGRHFVVHQHDHPIAGLHYDLRLQFSESSCLSFAIPYGLPGNPNSAKPSRLAIETRVHSLWNNLVESASHATGSLLIWDTGEYEVLNKDASDMEGPMTDDELDECTSDPDDNSRKLFDRFPKRSIKLRLHGTRLPAGYTISMHLPSANSFAVGYKAQPIMSRKRKRGHAGGDTAQLDPKPPQIAKEMMVETCLEARQGHEPYSADEIALEASMADASDVEDGNESIRMSNAYPDSRNTIGSIHQRAWIINLDRRASGFVKWRGSEGDTRWKRPLLTEGIPNGFEAFHVRGRDIESSIVTGRLAADLYADEGVVGYVGRRGWNPITI